MDRVSDEDRSLKITQRLRMDDSKLEEVRRRIALSGPNGWNILLAVPGNVEHRRGPNGGKTDCLADLVAYLREKKAAGVLALPPDCKQGSESGLLHIFPSCKFVHKYLLEHAPKLMMDYTTEDYMIVFLVSITS